MKNKMLVYGVSTVAVTLLIAIGALQAADPPCNNNMQSHGDTGQPNCGCTPPGSVFYEGPCSFDEMDGVCWTCETATGYDPSYCEQMENSPVTRTHKVNGTCTGCPVGSPPAPSTNYGNCSGGDVSGDPTFDTNCYDLLTEC